MKNAQIILKRSPSKNRYETLQHRPILGSLFSFLVCVCGGGGGEHHERSEFEQEAFSWQCILRSHQIQHNQI